MTEQELIDRATRAYFRRFPQADYPGDGSHVTGLDEDDGPVLVHLTNVSGELARYRYDQEADRLRLVAGS